MAHMLAAYPEEDVFVALEDDAAFDLVEFWPGALSELISVIQQDFPDWQVLQLAPSNVRDAQLWASRVYAASYNNEVHGAVAYAFRRTTELEEIVASAMTCMSGVFFLCPHSIMRSHFEMMK